MNGANRIQNRGQPGGSKDNTTYGRWHVEQMGVSRGFLEVGGETFEIDGDGYRDHTRGPRHTVDMAGHVWVQARFPDGRGLCIYQLWVNTDGVEEAALNEAFFMDSEGFQAATVVETPRLMSVEDIDQPIAFTLSDGSTELTLKGLAVSMLAGSFSGTFEFLFGVARGHAPYSFAEQAFVVDTPDGPVYGKAERGFRLPAL